VPIRLEPTTPPEDLRPDDPTGLLATEQEEIDLQEGRVLNRAGRVIRSLFTADFDPMLHPRNRRGRFIETPDRPRGMASPAPLGPMASPSGLPRSVATPAMTKEDAARRNSRRTTIRQEMQKAMASPAAKAYTPDELHEARVIAGLAHWVLADEGEHFFFGTARAGEAIDPSLDPHSTAAALYFELQRQKAPSPTLFRGQPVGTPPPDAETIRSWSESPIVALSFVEIGVDSDGYGKPLTLITQTDRQNEEEVWFHKDSQVATGTLERRDLELELYVDEAATATATMKLVESLDFTEAQKFPVLMQYIEAEGYDGPEGLRQSLLKLIAKEREFLQTSPAAKSITLKATAEEIRDYFQNPVSRWRDWGKLMSFNIPVTHNEGIESILPLFIDKLEQQIGTIELEDMPSGMASPAGGWTATEDAEHPIYPSTMTGKAGQKVRVGDLLTLDGQEWEVAHILQGKVVLDEASGDKKKVEVRVIDPKDTPGKPTELGGVKPAKPKKLVAGGKQTMHETSNVRMVEPYVESSTHDPTLALPKDSNLSEDQWEQFGLIEQMHYIDVMQRFGKWKSGAPIKQMVKEIEADFDSEIVNMVKQAHNSQYGGSSGGTLSLASFSGTGESGKSALEQRSKGMDLQGRLRDLYAWDLYNRTRSPSLTVFHGSNDNVAWWKKLFKDRWLFSGLSQSFNIDASLGFGNTIVATALSIRHIVLATTVNNWLGMFGSEREIAIVPQVKVDPKRSMVFRFPELSIKARKFLQVESKQPRAGAWLERLREHIDKGADLPIVIPPEIIMSQKSLKPPPPAALEAFADYKDIPEIKGEPYTPEQLKAKHGDLPFKHVDEKGRPEPRVAAEAGVKAGDFMIGMKGTLYWIGPDKTNNFGLRYHKIVKGSDGKLMFDGDSYAFEGDGANTYYFLKGNVKPLKDETDWDPAAWQFAAEDPILIRNMQVGDKFKVDGTPYELSQVPASMSISDDRLTVRDLETGIQGTINADFATTRLVPATGYVAGQTLQPAKGMTLAYQGKKHTITSVKKDGIVSVKPAGGTVVQLAPDDPALKDLFDPSAWLPSGETTLQNLSIGEMFHGGSGKTVRPYKVIGKDGNKIEWQNMDNGKKGSSPKTKKVAVLKPQGGTPGEADHKSGAPVNTEPPPPSDMPVTKAETAGKLISQEVAEQVGDVLLKVPAAELKEGTVIQHKRASDGMVVLYQVKTVDPDEAIIEQVSVEDYTGSGPVGKGSVSPENAMVVDEFKLTKNETLGDLLTGKTVDNAFQELAEQDKVFFYDTKLAATAWKQPEAVTTQVPTLTNEEAKAAAGIMANAPAKNLKVGVVFYDDSAKQFYKVQENNEGQVRILVSEAPEAAPITEITLGETEKLFGANPPPTGLIIYDLLDENEVAQEKVTVADEISDLPQAEIEPYKSAYGSGGKYKHDKIGEMTVGTIFQDKTGKLWSVQVSGANAVITDGVSNYAVNGDLRGKRLNEGLIQDAPVDAFALLNPPPAPEPVPHPYQEQKEVVPETPTSMIMDSMTPNQGMTVTDIADKTNLESNAYYIYKGELFMIGDADYEGELRRYLVEPDGEMVPFDTSFSTWHSWETVPDSVFVENEVLEEPTASETEPSGGELLKNVVDSTQTGYAEVEFEAGGKTFSVIAIGQKNNTGQQIYLKDMTTGETKNIPLTDDLTLDGVAREFSEPPPTATSEAVTTPGLGPNFTAEEVAAAPKIELNFYKSAYGSGGKYKHEKVGDLPDGADFTVKGDKSKWVKVKSMTGGWVLVWKLHGSASELGLVKANGRVRAV